MGRKKRKVRSRLEASTSHIPRSSQAATSSPSGSIKQATAGKKRKAEARKMKPSISATCVTSSNRTPSAGFATADMRAEPTAPEFLLADENMESRPDRYFIMKTKLAELSVPKHWSMVGEIASKFIFEERCTLADVSGPVLGVDNNLFIKLESVDDEIGVSCSRNDESSEMGSSEMDDSEMQNENDGLKIEVREEIIGVDLSDNGEDVEVLSSVPEPIAHLETEKDAETNSGEVAEEVVPDEVRIIYPPSIVIGKPLNPYTGQVTGNAGKSRTVSEAVKDALKTQQPDSFPGPVSHDHNYLRAASPEAVSSAYVCPACGQGYSTLHYYGNHILRHLKQECKFCGLLLDTSRTFHAHLPYNASKLECKLCRKIFSCKGLLDGHKVEHAEIMKSTPAFRCGKCDMTFFEARNYTKHFASHDQIVQCKICHERFDYAELLENHVIISHGKIRLPLRYRCEECPRYFHTPVGLALHYKLKHKLVSTSSLEPEPAQTSETEHTAEPVLPCGTQPTRDTGTNQAGESSDAVSSKPEISDTKSDQGWVAGAKKKRPPKPDDGVRFVWSFNDAGQLVMSKRLPNKERQMPKPNHLQEPKLTSTKIFKERDQWKMKVHRKVHQKTSSKRPAAEENNEHVCTTCAKIFIRRRHLIMHMHTHREANSVCEICGLKLKNLKTMHRHRLIHTGEKPYVCETCGMAFRQSAHLLRHKFVHSGERPHPCEVCEKKFKTATELRCHTRDYHAFGKACGTCGKSFSDRHMAWHQRRAHGVKTEVLSSSCSRICEFCGKLFKSNSDLQKHRRIHTGEKPYVCHVCGKSFVQCTGLYSHLRLHTGEKPYSCDVCHKKFRQSCSLTTHERVHSGERPFKCPKCDQRFKQRNHLKAHLAGRTHGRLDTKPTLMKTNTVEYDAFENVSTGDIQSHQ